MIFQVIAQSIVGAERSVVEPTILAVVVADEMTFVQMMDGGRRQFSLLVSSAAFAGLTT
jgi:hypothetical protein